MLAIALGATAQAADRALPLEAAVKRLLTDSPPPATMTPPTAAVTVPTTPEGKLPQYQLGAAQRRLPTAEERLDPRVRFAVALPERTLLVEATITINGRPFSEVREQRIERLLKDASETPSGVTATTSSLIERLRRLQQTTGELPSVEEVRWLLINWGDGPTVLWLNENFQRFRGAQRPEFAVLDRNRDGTVSVEEWQQAGKSLRECDLNRDDVVQFTEIAAAAKDVRDTAQPLTTGPVLKSLPKDGGAADLRLTVAFDVTNPDQSRLAITHLNPAFADAVAQATVDPVGIALPLGGTVVQFTAVQQDASDQIAMGAVCDGYPLLPALDPNDDGRLTLRELRGVNERLRPFDHNLDGALTSAETPPPLRVCISLGPIVHRELAGIRSVYRPATSPSKSGPEWFVRMDRNRDHDLTRSEFPGTDDQFRALDVDSDELISADEALAYDQTTESQ